MFLKKKKKAVSVLSVLFEDMYLLSIYLLGLVSMLCSLGFGAARSLSNE